jgi:hypothetical protein
MLLMMLGTGPAFFWVDGVVMAMVVVAVEFRSCSCWCCCLHRTTIMIVVPMGKGDEDAAAASCKAALGAPPGRGGSESYRPGRRRRSRRCGPPFGARYLVPRHSTSAFRPGRCGGGAGRWRMLQPSVDKEEEAAVVVVVFAVDVAVAVVATLHRAERRGIDCCPFGFVRPRTAGARFSNPGCGPGGVRFGPRSERAFGGLGGLSLPPSPRRSAPDGRVRPRSRHIKLHIFNDDDDDEG